MSNFIKYSLKNFKNEINSDLSKIGNTIWDFRYICYKLNYFMRLIPLPKINKNSFFEAVFIDFRVLPNIEFIIRNAIFKLGSNWSYTIVCGNDNYNFVKELVKNVDKNIKIICLSCNNLTQQEYSNLLTTETFWNKIYGEKVLIYQEDSLIFHGDILPFLNYDYIGAPFLKSSNDTPNCVGNGGLSLRTKCKMLEVIKKYPLEKTRVNSSTLNYMKYKNLNLPPEDVYFSKNMQEYYVGDVANWDTAYSFSSEQIFNPKSFGGHQYWISNTNWKKFTLKLFNFRIYKPKSDLNKYLRFKKKPIDYNKTKDISNAFDIDIFFFCFVNNLKYINDNDTFVYMYTMGLDGFIYHPKQIYNIFGNDIQFYSFLNNLYTFYDNNVYLIQDFVNKYVYNSDFEYLSNILIKKKYDTINDNYDTILLVFIGNSKIGFDLLYRIINYKKINPEFNVAFCINKNIDKRDASEIKKFIKNHFDFYAIYYSNEFGTDITPTLLMYDDISKNHNMTHIIKLHTKTISDIYNNLINYLLTNPLNKIIQEKRPDCNCIGPPDEYLNLNYDKFNSRSKNKYGYEINLNYSFVRGTMFYCDSKIFEKTIEFMKNNNYRAFLLNSLYENNSINDEHSPIHFLERIFGTIKL